jgi:hypothetical protein
MFGWAVTATWAAMNSRSVHAQGFMQPVPIGVTSAAAGVAIALVEARPEPEPKDISRLKYPRKLSVLLRNDTGSRIVVSAPDWISGRSTVPFHPPFWSIVQNENKAVGGWSRDKWVGEQSTITVEPGDVFRARLGLNHRFSPEDLRLRLNTQRVGTLVLPVESDGQDREWRITL